MPAQSYLACPDCDAFQRRVRGARAACFRCGAVLAGAPGRGAADRALAFTLAAIPLFVAANLLPLARMEAQGGAVQATVLGAAAALAGQRMPSLALLVLATVVVVPAILLGSAAYLLLGARGGQPPRGAVALFRLRAALRPWAQIEILLAGLMVAFGKLASLFHIAPGVGLLCMLLGLLLERAGSGALDPRTFWEAKAWS